MSLIYFLILLQCGLFCLSLRSVSGSAQYPSAAAQTSRVFRRTASEQAAVEYTLITLNSPDCEPYEVDDFPVRVQYRPRYPGLGSAGTPAAGEWISLDSMVAIGSDECNTDFDLNPLHGSEGMIHAIVRSYRALLPSINSSQRVQLRFVQSDHRGGFCDCWAVSNLTLTFEDSISRNNPLNQACDISGELSTTMAAFLEHSGSSDSTVICPSYSISSDTPVLGFCRGSASAPRGFVSAELGAETEPQCENTAAVVDTGRDAPLIMGDQCESMPHVKVTFFLDLNSNLETLDEGVELGYRVNDSEWIPIAFYSSDTERDDRISVGELTDNDLIIRGYSVPFCRSETHNVQLRLCGSEIIQENSTLSFRWLQTVPSGVGESVDEVSIDNVQIDLYSSTLQQVLLMIIRWRSSSSNKWTDIRRVRLHSSSLRFGEDNPTLSFGPLRNERTIISRGISTIPLYLNFQIQVSYTLITASSPGCLNTDPVSSPRLEYRASGSLSWSDIEPDNISISEGQLVAIRGYSASLESITLSELPIQFRFVQSEHRGGSCDCWAVANLTVTPPNGQARELFEVCGGNTSEALLSLLDMTDQTLVTLFNGGVVAGFCGDNPNIPRVFVTQFGGMSLQGSGECNGSLPVTLKPTTEEVMTTPDSFVIGAVNPLEPAVRDSIMENENFRSILVQIDDRMFATAIVSLNDVLNLNSIAGNANLTQAAYLLSSIVNGFGSQTVARGISQLILSVASQLLEISQNRVESGANRVEDLAGSTLLQTMDKFALNNHNVSHPIMSDNIVFQVQEISLNDTDDDMLSGVEDEGAEIRIPREVLEGRGDSVVRMASLLFRNMSGLLPERLEGNDDDGDSDDIVFRLASPVISASFQCDTCTTSNLSTPVQVTFKHTEYDQALVESDPESSIVCGFWDFDDDIEEQPGAILYPGRWSEEGCETSFNSTMTVCKCNHLTHFAILLSARPLSLSRQKTLTLQITGYIGVTVSLVAMTITVIVFLFLKGLRTMRNYIHIQLCVTLGIAQIIFVAGIEPHLGEGHLVGGVPVGCRLVAVLLHYWFLVSFMWMLMEGVVLYVALVRVFVKYHARYIAAFTIASYGLPLLYVGVLTVPLGFARSEEMRRNHTYDYGYQQACYLNPATKFIWSFIAPVIVILLANIGFFIMAAIIMNRHQKRQRDKSTVQRVRHWLKVSISLTVVMGITWIIGVLVIEVEQLFALAFIFTIFVAFQGLFIFVIFVLLSRQVRESYAKWWKAKVAESDFLSSHFGEKHPTLGTYASSTAQSQPVPLHEKPNNYSSSRDDDNELDVKNGQIGNACKSPDVEDSTDKKMYSFDVTYIPTSSETAFH